MRKFSVGNRVKVMTWPGQLVVATATVTNINPVLDGFADGGVYYGIVFDDMKTELLYSEIELEFLDPFRSLMWSAMHEV